MAGNKSDNKLSEQRVDPVRLAVERMSDGSVRATLTARRGKQRLMFRAEDTTAQLAIEAVQAEAGVLER